MKTLIFGNANVGKTSLMKTTCEGYSFLQIMNIPPTKGVNRESYLFRGLLELNVWDSGGQNKYLKRYFSDAQQQNIFSEVDIPIFVEDTSELHPEQAKLFKQFVEYIIKFSPEVKKIFVLMNKTDLEDSNPDKLYELMNLELDSKFKKLIEFTPVSVKEGTAQYRLIEILDNCLQNSVIELEKMKRIRKKLELMKKETNCEIVLINRPDGLITTSTLGEIKASPLKTMPLEIALLDSNISEIYEQIRNHIGQKNQALFLNSYLFETQNQFVILKEIDDYAFLMVITPEKSNILIGEILQKLNGSSKTMKFLKNLIKHR